MKKLYSTIMLLALMVAALGLTACNNGKVEPQQLGADSTSLALDSTAENCEVIYEDGDRRIYLVFESDHFSCYTRERNNPPKKIVFGHAYGNDGFPIMYSQRYGEIIYLVGDFIPNSNGWTIRFPIYKVDAKTFKVSFVDDGAAVNFGKEGFKVAQCRLTNPDADCTANEVWVMHDTYYDINGKKVREDKSEYSYDVMEKKYGDSLVNARIISKMAYE